jgi:geranylgeranyl diphosphate synthase type I
MIEGKTGALFGAACELGAWSAGADVERAGAYARLGRAYGCAIHLEDDVLVTWGEGGAPCSARAGRQRWSFPLVWAAAGPPSPARDTIIAAYAEAPAGEAPAGALVAALDALGARDASLRELGAELEHADDVARAFAIDRSERVRSLFAQALRRVA